MDDMVYQCCNQNSIYVLNAGYNPSYGDYGTHAMHTQMTATGREMNGSRTTRTRNSIGASCSSAACSLQHKFKSFGTAAATAAAAAASNGNSSAMPSSAATATATATATAIATTAATMATTIIAATATPTASTALTAAAAAATPTATTTTTANYVNPVATSMSTAAMCSPATAALQKLFNCNVVIGGGGGGNVCQNVSHRNHHQQQQQQQQQQQHQGNHNGNGNGSNNNCPAGSHNNSCLSATSSSHRSICDPHEGSAGVGVGVGAGALPSMANKKKCTNVKSTLIAKKTKFLKFLEEEKWRSSNNIAQLAARDAEACGAPLALLPSSNEAEPYAASRTTSAMAATSSLAAHSGIKQNNNNSAGEELAGAEQQQNKLNNWSMHNDSNNKLTNYKQQQQQLEMNKQTAKSSYELYQEAADILGLSCSLCDNCRCLDCQSGYFDCADDDDESYSEQSLMDEYDEYDYHGYGYEQEQEHEQQASSLLTSAQHAGPNQPAMTQPDQHQLHHQQQQEPQQQQLQAAELNLCYAVDCQQNCIRSDDGQTKEGTFQTDSDYVYEKERETEVEAEAEAESGPNTATKSEHRLAIDFDLINATSSQVLQNCATFNDLSLLERQVEPFT